MYFEIINNDNKVFDKKLFYIKDVKYIDNIIVKICYSLN